MVATAPVDAGAVVAGIGLGANLGALAETLRDAAAALGDLPATRLRALSSFYRSAPVDATGPDFLNAVALLETRLDPPALLAELQRIEQRHGRERPHRNAPRTLDLDLLFHGDAVVATPALTLPHPRLHERAFVLQPLAEIAPDLALPGIGRVADRLAGVADQRIERVAPAASDALGLGRFRQIVVEGPIGVGKSSLARRLAQRLGADLMLEQAEENPFLGRFYADPAGYALQAQLFFLFQRVKQMQQAAQPGMFAHGMVADFLFAKDEIFARLNLSDDEFRLYQQMYGQVAPRVPQPDLVVWLQASPATLLERIRRRGIPMEQGIGAGYLQRLCDAYVVHFHAAERAPVLAVGTEHFNPVDDDADFARLVDRIASFRGPREFFNSHVEIAFG